MREILFRGKTEESGEWVEGSLDLSGQTGFSHVIRTHDKSKSWNSKVIIPETVGQFTKLTDKNGVKIFEGDIVKCRYFPLGADKNIIEYYHTGIVIWPLYVLLKRTGTKILNTKKALSYHRNHEETFKHPSAGKDWIDKTALSRYEVEIIGNIHNKSTEP